MCKFSKKKLNYKDYYIKKQKRQKPLYNSKKMCTFAVNYQNHRVTSKQRVIITTINTFINYKKSKKK